MEEYILDTRFELNVKSMTNFPGQLNIQGRIISVAGGTASDSDFANLIPITFRNEADIRLFTINDVTTLEYNDYVILTFYPASPAVIPALEGVGEYIRTSAIVNIIDNDRLEINFEESDYAITEGGGLSTPITLQFRNNQNPFTITFSPVTIDSVEGKGLGANFINSETIEEEARAEPADFTYASLTIEIPAATTVFEVPVFFNVTDDDIDEVEQSFAIVAELGPDVLEVPFNFSCFQLQVGETLCFGRRGATEIRITDNDPMIIGFTTRSQTVSEGDARPGDEFIMLTIDVETERISERNHTIIFRHLESASTAIVQSEGITNLNPRFNPLFDAIFGSDLSDPIEERVILEPGSDEIRARSTSVLNDFRSEEEECYTIGIETTDVYGGRELFTCNKDENMPDNYFCRHTVCITDDDEPFVIAFVQTTYTVVESEGPVEVCVSLTRPPVDILEETVRVRVINDEGSIYIPAGVRLATPDEPNFMSRYLMAERTDYAEQTLSANAIDDQLINATRRIICYEQPIYDDGRLEVSEYAGLTLGVNKDGTTVFTEVQELYNFASIRILDDDRARVGLERTFYSVSEGVGVVELCAVVYEPNITCPIEFPFNIRLSTADGTAGSSTDYRTLGVILQFPECETQQCTIVNVVTDSIDESEEFFRFNLARTPRLHPRIDLDPIEGQVVINENNAVITVGYELTIYTTSEGQGSLELSIILFNFLTGGAPRPFTLSVSTEDGSAVAPGDYGAVMNEIITFTTGQTRTTHRITIHQDDDCENSPNENFFVGLKSDLPMINLIRRRIEVIIDDSECIVITVGYELTTYTTSEDQEAVNLSIIIFAPPTGGAPRPFTLSVITEDGSAVVPGDYGAVTNEIVTFTTGQMRATHTIIINQDDDCENSTDENFFSNIALNSGQRPISVIRPRTTVIIYDPECTVITVGYEFTTYTTSEGQGSVELSIIVSNFPTVGAPRPFTLSVSTENGSAVAPGDYRAVTNQIITFTTGQMRATHTITINQDDICENNPSENFLSNIALDSGQQPIDLIRRAQVVIRDSAEAECKLEGFSQCFTGTGCTGDQVPASSQRECCVGTNGLSFTDNDGTCSACVVHGFAQEVYNVMEGRILDTRFELNVKGMTNFPGLLFIQGTITSVAGGTASDYDFGNLIPIPFQNEADIRLFITNDDTTLEYNDYVILTFTPANPGAIDGLEGVGEYVRNSAIVNIIDNDRLEINFEESDYSIQEDRGLSTPIHLQFRINQNPFTITFTPVTIDAVEDMGLGRNFIYSDTIEEEFRAEPADFTHASLTIEIPAATTVFEVPDFFNVTDDDIDEVEQSFAIVAELGPDVPDTPFNFSCFQLQAGDSECFGRRGVTEIRITDNDPMIIGFTSRSQTVSEGDAPPGSDFNLLTIAVATERTSERIHTILFRHLESGSTAIVQNYFIQRDPLFDALFGNVDSDPLEEIYVLDPGSNVIPSLVTEVLNDFRPEDDECYTIGIFITDITGAREFLFTCNGDDSMADNFFCLHTICITNDDEPFVVAFVQKMYTVVESEGPVEVCVNLTRPPVDILAETVRVRVTNDEGSIYIPAGVRLATPDTPDFLSRYLMRERTDYAEQTFGVNAIDDQLINATRRIICYNQPIYDDERLEVSEYAGLTLDIDDNIRFTTVPAEVQDLYDFASIRIVDDDRARVGLERTFSENVGVVELCVVVYEPNITCPIEFPFNIRLSTDDGAAVGELDMILQFDTCQRRQCTFFRNLNQPDEFFIVTLERTPGLDSRIDLAPTMGRVMITDDGVLVTVGLSCTRSGGISEVVIDCTDTQLPTTVQCSFNRGPQHSCSLPLVLNNDVSPLGNHSVRIITSTGAEATVSYTISTVSVNVPPLGVYLMNGSPRLVGNSVEAEFVTTRPVAGVRCFLRSQQDRIWQDCSSGRVVFTDLQPGPYVLKVHAFNRKTDVATVKRVFVVTSDPTYCSLVLVNRGVTVGEDGSSAVVEFQPYGPATEVLCSLDGGDPYICASPVRLTMLGAGRHELEISPRDCDGDSKTLSVHFSA